MEGSGQGSFVSFKGRVDSVVALGRDGRVIELGNGGVTAIVVGDMASVQGFAQPGGYVQATKLVVNKR